MSVVALAGGVGALPRCCTAYLARGARGPAAAAAASKGQRIFERVLVTLSWRWARALDRLLGTARLQPQLRILVLRRPSRRRCGRSASAGSSWRPGCPVATSTRPSRWSGWSAPPAPIGAAWQAKYHRLAALVLLGGAGLVTCVTFVWLSAPDLAADPAPRRDRDDRPAAARPALAAEAHLESIGRRRWRARGAAAPAARPRHRGRLRRRHRRARLRGDDPAAARRRISRFFLEHAYTEGGGTNVVNVILVDFRGFDTFGEITVLGIVGADRLRAAAPLPPGARERRSCPSSSASRTRSTTTPAASAATRRDYLLVPSVIMRWMFPAIVMLAAYLLPARPRPAGRRLRGRHRPGDRLHPAVPAGGTRWVEDRLRILPVRWIGVGLLIAAATGAGSWLFGYPFLTSHAPLRRRCR